MYDRTTGDQYGGFYHQVIPLNPVYGRTGWICPKCNKGINPDFQYCPCSYEFTWVTSSGTYVGNGSTETKST
jgi:hypothetical protein